MFRVKICGITNPDDAQAAADAGADAIGLNFFSGSPRVCQVEQAVAIAQRLPKGVCKVGVFLNAPANEIREIARQAGLDAVQLHGDEPPEAIHQLRGLAIVRAFHAHSDLADVAEYLRHCHRLASMPRMVLLDAREPGQYGGTGVTLDWQAVVRNRQQLGGMPLVLAGGLTPSNVAQAIAIVHPWAVDVASGVESAPGKKQAPLVNQFVAAARAALAQAAARKN